MGATETRNVLVLAFSKLKSDPRVLREILALKDICSVTSAGFTDPEIPDTEFIQLESKLPKTCLQKFASKIAIIWRAVTHRYSQYYWGQQCIMDAKKKLDRKCFDLVIANDIETLPLALNIAGDAPVLFDAHEYAPLQSENILKMRILDKPYKYFLCKRFIPQVAAFITVAEGIARQYLLDTGIAAEVITNAPEYVNITPRFVANDTDCTIEMIHHGAAIQGRRLELLIDMMDHLDRRFRLTLMLVPTDANYLQELKRRATGRQIIFREPVPFDQIIPTLTCYDVGLAVIYPGTFNYRHCLPNKFFEFVQARLAIVAGPSPEMAPIIQQYNLGVVAQDFSPQSLAEAISNLNLPAINIFKNSSNLAARKLSAYSNLSQLQSIARRLLKYDHQYDNKISSI